ncbi:MAG: 16S rRNA (guanine(527)-N(7))-methyltransferase RsmG [Lentimicrobiaceae bacterium]|jgi:16S rRNA (guanine527-N7)-methyltransferase|nr:16S rRNA (guanine(527)-N(7))-methyltransferase RsmG [Lentimicrobiaceae bacterium]
MEIIEKYFPGLSHEKIGRFVQLQAFYENWNQKINLISRNDIVHLYEHHVLHSLSIAKVIDFKDRTSIMDVGTGGGFPGIPLAILFSGCNFYLVDSIGKKIQVVNAVIKDLGLTNVKAEQKRVEQVQEKFDFVISRAVTQLPIFFQWVQGKIISGGFNNLPNGILYLKGGDLEDELCSIKKKYKVFNLSDFFTEEYFITKKIVYIKR